MKKKQQTKKPAIVNTYNIVKGEPLTNFGGIKPRFDSDLNEIPYEMTASARKVLDAYSNDDSIHLAYDAEKNEVRISGKCTSGKIKLN